MSFLGPSKPLPHFNENTVQPLTADSIRTVFDLDHEIPTASSVLAVYGGIVQEPGFAYTTTSTQITFTFVPQIGKSLYVVFLKNAAPVGVPGDSTITEDKLAVGAVLRKGHLYGLELANNITDLIDSIDINIGECVNSSGSVNMELSSILTKNINTVWTAGTDNGGLMSGTAQDDTWYHNFLIKNTSTGAVDAGFDTDITAAGLLATSGYHAYRRIGSVRRETAANRLFYQNGDHISYRQMIQDITGALPAIRTLKTISVPSGLKVLADLVISVRMTSPTPHWGLFYDPDLPDTAPSGANHTVAYEDTFGGGWNSNNLQIRTNTSGQYAERSTVAYSRLTNTLGYFDPRGKY